MSCRLCTGCRPCSQGLGPRSVFRATPVLASGAMFTRHRPEAGTSKDSLPSFSAYCFPGPKNDTLSGPGSPDCRLLRLAVGVGFSSFHGLLDSAWSDLQRTLEWPHSPISQLHNCEKVRP